MKIIADLHVHSRHARATSKALDLPNLEKWAGIKGVSLLGTGDFTHPVWIKEIKSSLKEDGTGILRTASGFPFVLQTEISLVYTQGGKGRRVHHIMLAPDLDVVSQITDFLLSKGRVDYDGRPIFGMSSIELAEKLHEISPETELIPAHAWTPWMSIFGSKSGFNSIKECFAEKAHLIHAIETGMSSDPGLNWQVSALDDVTLISNSDLHSFWPWRLGREANVFEMKDLTYKGILAAIRERKGFVETIEVDPGYGKYHFDGHRNCGVSMSPAQTREAKGICPKCRTGLTIGVLSRIEELSDRKPGYRPQGAIPYRTLIPISEIISALNGWALAGKKTWAVYNQLIERFGSEMNVLLEASYDELKNASDERLAAAIMKNRQGKVEVTPGFDGEYGKPFFSAKAGQKSEPKPETNENLQKGLGEFF